MSKILYVVHRYAPFPGGSENYVRDMAEETQRRGNEVAVFTGEHKGDLNGVRVSSDTSILLEKWDLIVVHGGDVGLQDFVLNNANKIPSPILFMLIVPSDSKTYQRAIQNVKYVGCSTIEDWDYAKRKAILGKSVQINHGIDDKISVGKSGFRQKYNISEKYMFLSCGGFWPNKAMPELCDVFKKIDRKDCTLVLTGYDNRHNIMPESTDNIRSLMIDDRQEVLSAIKDADLYIMHSHKEGFGLVLLESMLNKTPWASRNIAGAKLLNDHGFTYNSDDELIKYLKNFKGSNQKKIDASYKFVKENHLIKNTVDNILELV